MSVHTIIKAMKLGLIRLNRCELFYFKSFEVEPYTLQFQDTWTSKFSDELIANLRSTGLSESECWHIIIYGVDSQSPRILCRLLLNGIDVPGIINWQSPVTHASPKIIQFLKHIGIKEDVVQFIEQYGINEEIEQILSNIGYDETEEKGLAMEEIICECNSTMLGQETNSSGIINNICETSNSRSTSTSINMLDYFQQCNSQCHLGTEKNIMEELSVQRNNYLR
ncbi:uncharacterized protein LOC143343515 [Colletes latitarsis]|uniref:uncharacterized protein LOC143343515 n=1 Tax=Colletes latitarsis TaxID=2605962 RepID=UPI004035AB07